MYRYILTKKIHNKWNYNKKVYNLFICLYLTLIITYILINTLIFKGLLWAFSLRSMDQVSNNTINLQYSSTRSTDFAIKGAMSMCLTFINIICIFGCGIVILKVVNIVFLNLII